MRKQYRASIGVGLSKNGKLSRVVDFPGAGGGEHGTPPQTPPKKFPYPAHTHALFFYFKLKNEVDIILYDVEERQE